MPLEPSGVSDLTATVKSREVQRGQFAEMSGDHAAAARHFLAAAHLELVLAEDYAQSGPGDLALRSRIGAASCLWRTGDVAQSRTRFAAAAKDHPRQAAAIRQLVADLEKGTARAS
jgi:hypothetical protein